MAKYFLARMLDDEGRRPQAQAQFREVLRYVPEESDVHESLGKSYGAGGRQGLAYVHLCYAALYAHRKEPAERYFNKAKALQGQNPQEFKRLDTVYKERKEIWKKL
jgi:tetratricopeptide (TPR) repeat protein